MNEEIALVDSNNNLDRIVFKNTIDPNAKVREGWSWLPVVREEGDIAFEGVEGGVYTIRTEKPIPAPAPTPSVSTYTVVRRIEAKGKVAEASAALEAEPAIKYRFLTCGYIPVDDMMARAVLTSIGLDPDEILAPEVL